MNVPVVHRVLSSVPSHRIHCQLREAVVGPQPCLGFPFINSLGFPTAEIQCPSPLCSASSSAIHPRGLPSCAEEWQIQSTGRWVQITCVGSPKDRVPQRAGPTVRNSVVRCGYGPERNGGSAAVALDGASPDPPGVAWRSWLARGLTRDDARESPTNPIPTSWHGCIVSPDGVRHPIAIRWASSS
jgi:hypothetical protein